MQDEDGAEDRVGDRAGTKSLALGMVWRSCPSQRRVGWRLQVQLKVLRYGAGAVTVAVAGGKGSSTADNAQI